MSVPTRLSSFLVSFMRVVGSTVVGKHNAVLVGGDGGVSGLDIDGTETDGERIDDAESYGAPGIVFRPRPPSDAAGEQLTAESMALRLGGKLTPFTWRDLRFNRVFPSPKPGTVAFVGYGGGFLAFDDAAAAGPDDGKASKATLYIPYAYSGGAPTKAHVIALDPDQETVQIIHGDGLAITMDPDNGITMRADSSTWATLAPGKFDVVAAKISLNGNVAVGVNTATAIPFTGGPAMVPSASFFYSTP
jgi:hypothetical protein